MRQRREVTVIYLAEGQWKRIMETVHSLHGTKGMAADYLQFTKTWVVSNWDLKNKELVDLVIQQVKDLGALVLTGPLT